MLSCGLVGMPLAGKTTLFELLTTAQGSADSHTQLAAGKRRTETKLANVPDGRVAHLSSLFRPKKTTYAQIAFTDIPGLGSAGGAGVVGGAGAGGGSGAGGGGSRAGSAAGRKANPFLEGVREADALVFVLRAFNSGNPADDLAELETELVISDLDLAERRLDKLASRRNPTSEEAAAKTAIEACITLLSDGTPLYRAKELPKGLPGEGSPAEARIPFLTAKRVIWVVNLDEDGLASHSYPGRDELRRTAEAQRIPLIELAAELERQIQALSEEEAEVFRKEYGITTSGLEQLARAAYDHLNLQSFFTAGDDEVKAWTVRRGAGAREAAGKIHTDIERGFIRAEVLPYETFRQLAGTLPPAPGNAGERVITQAKEKGLLRLEGKDYPVADGDIINFRFAV